MDNVLSKIKSRKFIIIFIIVVILLGEATWAFFTLSKTKPKEVLVTQPGSQAAGAVSSLSLQAPKNTLTINEEMEISININSSKRIDGADLIITYNPLFLTILADEDGSNPVKVGNLFDDYPVNMVDDKTGKILISGITSKSGGVEVKGLLGKLTVRGKESGQSPIKIEFIPGKTVESNLIDAKTGKDVLDNVTNLDITIKR